MFLHHPCSLMLNTTHDFLFHTLKVTKWMEGGPMLHCSYLWNVSPFMKSCGLPLDRCMNWSFGQSLRKWQVLVMLIDEGNGKHIHFTASNLIPCTTQLTWNIRRNEPVNLFAFLIQTSNSINKSYNVNTVRKAILNIFEQKQD